MPIPSSAESATLFFEANASARPRMMQLTTISDEDAERRVKIGYVGFHAELHDGDERSDYDDKRRNAHLVRDQVLDQRNGDVRAGQYEQGRHAHAQPVDRRGGGAEGRTHSQQQHVT